MTSAMSKRQQARNEKALQEILRDVPGNNVCADCQARNPTWASWSLGIFLCMRCAAIHRKLGTHISKVKSLSMDAWTNEQVENMRKVGNFVSNKSYNPTSKIPPVPVDADEADSAMERFIRQKYMNRELGSTRKHNTGSTASDETPPPLPPKTTSRFGFRSASSIFPLGNKSKKAAHDPSPSSRDVPPSPRRGKASSDSDSAEDTNRKLAKLRDMGFGDSQRNAIVLKGVNGNLERAIEALVRLSEGDKVNGVPPRVTQENGLSFNRSSTPRTPGSGQESTQPRPLSPTNPFDMLDMPPAPQPLSSQSTGTLSSRNPFGPAANTNPFGIPPQSSHGALNQAFSGLSLAPTQPLFPHHTGGIAQQNPQVIYQQPITPQIPATNQFPGMNFSSNQTYPQPQSLQPKPTSSYNPFFSSQQQPQQQPQQPQQQQQQLGLNTGVYGGTFGNNPFARSPTRIASPTLTQIPEQSQPAFYGTPTPPSQPQASNPFFTQSPAQTQYPAQQFQQQPTGQVSQQPGQFGQWQMPHAATFPQRPDKASIMALYNQPQLAPNPFQQTQDQSQGQGQEHGQAQHQAYAQAPAPSQGTPNPLFHAQTFPLQQPTQVQQQQQQFTQPPSAISPAPGSKNPFLSNSAIQVETPGQPQWQPDFAPKPTGRSRDSIMATGPEWSNGRHSPDAFASLSARDLR